MTATFLITLMLAGAARAASTSVLHSREHRQQATLHRDRGTIRFFRRHRWLVYSNATRAIALKALRFARAEIAWTQRELARTHSALRPRFVVGHLSGWLCIHSREGAWNAQTGNGFYGGLQMTYGWAGRVANAALLAPAAQMTAAESEASEHRWSYEWMRGQWPNTYPRCARLFR